MSSITDIANFAIDAAGNGTIVFGFVTQTDPGLPVAEYVTLPHGTIAKDFAIRNTDDADNDFAENFLNCLWSDAAVVAAKDLPDPLKPFVAANRAYAFAGGYYSADTKSEVTISPNALDNTAKTAIARANAHVALAAQMNMQHGTLAIFCTSVNYYESNHNTCGPALPKGQIKAIRVALGLPDTVTNKHITDAVYFGGHASDKRLVLRSILRANLVAQLREVRLYVSTYIAASDQWAKLRIGPDLLPAGTAVLGLLKVVLKKVADHGLLGVAPAPAAVAALKSGYAQVSTNPGAFHPGAKYLFNADVVVLSDVEDLKGYLATFAGFCQAAGICPTITNVPHVQELIANRSNPRWTQMGKMFAKGVDISKEVVQAAAAAFGVGFGATIPSPVDDAAGYKTAVDTIVDELDSISL